MAKPGNIIYDRGETWSHEETTALIQLWSDDRIQHRLETTIRNTDIFEAIAKELNAQLGTERSAAQCRTRLKRMKAEYARAKKNLIRGGKKFAYFDAMDVILKDKITEQSNLPGDSFTGNESTDWTNEEDGLQYFLSANASPSTTGSRDESMEYNDDKGLPAIKTEQPDDSDTYGSGTLVSTGVRMLDALVQVGEKRRSDADIQSLRDAVMRLEDAAEKRARRQEENDRVRHRNEERRMQQFVDILEKERVQQKETFERLMTSNKPSTKRHDDGMIDKEQVGNDSVSNGESSIKDTVEGAQRLMDVVRRLVVTSEERARKQEEAEKSRIAREEDRLKLFMDTLERQRREEKDMFYKFMDMQMKMFQMFCSTLNSKVSANPSFAVPSSDLTSKTDSSLVEGGTGFQSPFSEQS